MCESVLEQLSAKTIRELLLDVSLSESSNTSTETTETTTLHTDNTTTSPTTKRKRKKSTKQLGKKAKLLTDEHNISDCISLACGCSLKCNQNFTFNQVSQCRKLYAAKSEKEKTLFVRSLLSGRTTDGYMCDGNLICENYLKRVHGITNSKFKKVKHLIRHNYDFTQLNEPRQNKQKANNKRTQFKIWFNSFVENYGEPNPAEDEIHLNGFQKYRQIYDIYAAENSEHYGFYHFKCMIRREFPTVKLYKHTRLGICDICMQYCTKLKAAKSEEERSRLKRQQENHKRIFYQERKAYDENIAKAKLEPEKYLSIIIDGATATKYPNLLTPTKTSNNILTLNITNYGLIAHGRDQEIKLLLPTYEGGSNLSLTVLFEYLVKLKSQNKLPKKLLLQCDNCPKELKNKYAIGILAILCYLDWFDEIFISSLIVGHTHTDIDRLFSYHSKYFKHNDCFDPQQFIDNITNIYKTNIPKISFLTKMYNFKDFVENYVFDIHNMNAYHGFKISKINGKIMLQCRQYNFNNPEWSNPIEIFKTQLVTVGIPLLVKPLPIPREDILKGVRKLKDTIDINVTWYDTYVKDDSPIYDNTIQSDFWNTNSVIQNNNLDMEDEDEDFNEVSTSTTIKHYHEPVNGIVDLNLIKQGDLIAFRNSLKSRTYSIGELLVVRYGFFYVSKFQYIPKHDQFEDNEADNLLILVKQEEVILHSFTLRKDMTEKKFVRERIESILFEK